MPTTSRRTGKKDITPEAMADSGQSLADRAYSALEELIVTLRLAPGSAVSESELSQRLGIGRTPIREALRQF